MNINARDAFTNHSPEFLCGLPVIVAHWCYDSVGLGCESSDLEAVSPAVEDCPLCYDYQYTRDEEKYNRRCVLYECRKVYALEKITFGRD